MTACPDQVLLLQALVDGELDAANAVSLEMHLRTCAGCTEEHARIEVVRSRLADADLRHRAPAALRNRIEQALATPPAAAPVSARRPAPAPRPPQQRFTLPGFDGAIAFGQRWSGGLVTGVALSAALVVAMPQFTRQNTEDQLIASHIRSLSLSSHLTDIATSNRHVVKPWFNGKIDFAPHVPELVAQGFPLVGGRLDVLDGHEVAAIVYKRRLHTINLFVRPAPALALPVGIATKHDGYSVVRWSDAGLEYWAVSDIDLDELQLFRRDFVNQPSL
jgi:anti-sigma factor RsiW